VGIVPSRHLIARLSSRNQLLLAAGLVVLWMLTLTPFLTFASSNYRLVEAFSTDEALQLNLLRDAAGRNSFALNFGPYGHLMFNGILLVLRIVPGPPTDARILYVGRALSVLFAGATALLTFAWARRSYGTAPAWIAFSLLLVNRTLYVETAEIKPDDIQLFFLMLALFFVARLADEPRPRWLVLASATAGLAFAAKYSGMFVLPLAGLVVLRRPPAVEHVGSRIAILRVCAGIAAVALLMASTIFNVEWIASHLTSDGHIDAPVTGSLLALLTVAARVGGVVAGLIAISPWLWNGLRRWKYGLGVVWSAFIMVSVFVATFVAVSPYSIRKAAFVKGMIGEAAFAVPYSDAEVIGVVRGIGSAVEWPALWAALLTIAWLLWAAWRKPSEVTATDGVLIGWIALYTIVLIAPVHEFYVDYALPLAPPIAMLAGRGVAGSARWLGNRAPGRPWLAAGALWLVVVAAEAPLAAGLVDGRNRQLARDVSSDQVQVAKWLECRAPASARVAYDHFVYIPPAFQNATVTWGGTRQWLSTLDPDIVVVYDATASYAMGRAENADYYQCLSSGKCGYQRALTKGEPTVYAKTTRLAEWFREDVRGASGCS